MEQFGELKESVSRDKSINKSILKSKSSLTNKNLPGDRVLSEHKKKTVKSINEQSISQKLAMYLRNPSALLMLVCVLLAAMITVGVLGLLVGYILIKGIPYLNLDLFAWQYTSDNVSMMPAIINTLTMTVIALVMAVPLGMGAAIYLVEYAKKDNKLVSIVRITAETLSGIPSIIYGLFGMLFFVTSLKWGYSILAGACTVAIMVLPVIMRTTEEALLAVPDSYREGSFGLGAGRLRTIFKIILPAAVPGILSGIILAVGRIVGETAALMYTAGTVADASIHLMASGRTLAVHMYSLSREGLHVNEAYATAVVLLIVVMGINGFSGFLAKKISKSK